MVRSVLALAAVPLLAQESLTTDPKLAGLADAYFTRLAEQHWKARAAKVAAIRTPDQVRARQTYIRETMLASIGGWPEKTPLNARITGTMEHTGYRIEKLLYESLPGFKVTANVYVPTGRPGPFPAVLGVAGHSDAGKASGIYQSGWIGMARRGMLVLAYDPPGQGERSEYWDPVAGKSRTGIGTREHTMAGTQCLLTGTSIARYEVWDGIRAVDYLLTRSDVDPKRLAVAGNSGGGTQSAYLAVFEPRLAAAAPSCYITSWEKQWAGGGPQDAEQVFDSFLKNELDFPDFLIAMAPRPIKMMTAIRDFFPIEGARATFAEAQRVFEAAGVRDKVDFFEYDDGHGWSKPRREATYRWFEKHLNGRDDEGVEPEIEVEPAASLNVTSTGQLATSGGSETVASLNAKLATKLHAARSATRGGDPASWIRARLKIEATPAAATARKMGETGRDGYRIEKLIIEGELPVPGLLFIPAAGTGPRPAILHIHGSGKTADAAPGGDIESMVRAGNIVLSVDLPGWGETARRAPGSGGYTGSYQTYMRGFLVGRYLPELHVNAALRSLAWLRARNGVDPGRVALFGKGNGGVVALLAATFDKRVQKVAMERSVTSYMAIANAPMHENILDIVIPGVLKDFDLPDLTRSLGSRPVWVIDPRTPMGGPAAAEEYKGHANVQVGPRPEGWSFSKVYANWLAL
ncbi:MAG: hypothetical protein FJW39_23075 [Acidobacteria bacterium]|nr:hypothetical protein [Acidobacteriota bacterium]